MLSKEDLIIQQIDTLSRSIDNISEQVTLCRVDIAGLKIKSGIWGAIAGMVPAAIGLAMWVMSTWK